MSEREIHFKIFDESVVDLEVFKKKHGFETDYDAIIAMVGMVISMDKGDDYILSFLGNGTVNIHTKVESISFVRKS